MTITSPNAARPALHPVIHLAGDDFLDMVRYLIAGSMLAAAIQTLVPQRCAARRGAGTSRLCWSYRRWFVSPSAPRVDAFLALALHGILHHRLVLAFLDLLAPWLISRVRSCSWVSSSERAVAYLILPSMLLPCSWASGPWNLNIGW